MGGNHLQRSSSSTAVDYRPYRTFTTRLCKFSEFWIPRILESSTQYFAKQGTLFDIRMNAQRMFPLSCSCMSQIAFTNEIRSNIEHFVTLIDWHYDNLAFTGIRILLTALPLVRRVTDADHATSTNASIIPHSPLASGNESVAIRAHSRGAAVGRRRIVASADVHNVARSSAERCSNRNSSDGRVRPGRRVADVHTRPSHTVCGGPHLARIAVGCIP